MRERVVNTEERQEYKEREIVKERKEERNGMNGSKIYGKQTKRGREIEIERGPERNRKDE